MAPHGLAVGSIGVGIAFNESKSELNNLVISTNNTQDQNGGGMVADGSNITMNNVQITFNDAGTGRGGGIYIYGNSSLIANDLIMLVFVCFIFLIFFN